MVFMEENGLQKIASFDDHFKEAGFQTVP
jgi:hypothetical protein